MFFRGHVEICIHLRQINNIFLRRSSELNLRLTLSHDDPVFGTLVAKPISILSSHLLSSSITTQSYVSRPFRILTSISQIPIGDTVILSTEIDAMQKMPVFRLLCELIIYDKGQHLVISQNVVEIHQLSSSHLPIYFDEFGFVVGFEAEIYMGLSSFTFHNNQHMVKELMAKVERENQQNHIKEHKVRLIPPLVRTFSEFINAMSRTGQAQTPNEEDAMFFPFIRQLNITSAFLVNTIENIGSSNRTHLTEKEMSPHKKRRIFDSGITAMTYKEFPNSFTTMEIMSTQIMGLWDTLVLLVSKPHPIYSTHLRNSYINDLSSYYFQKNVANIPVTSPPVHQVETNNYKVNIQNLNFRQSEKEFAHVIVFVHGINAHSYDMESLRNMIKFLHPSVDVYLSKDNEEKTNDKIADQGQRLALEIKNYLKSRYTSNKTMKLSMICHSMGGLIARASLEYLEFYRENLHALVTICSPHLGQLLHQSALIKTTMYLLNKFSPSSSMLELNMEDGLVEESCISKLSLDEGIGWFNHLVLINVKEDNIVPTCSARIEEANEGMINVPEYRIYHRLIHNIYKSLKAERVTRIQFQGTASVGFDSFIGKSQHIELIKDCEAIRLLAMILYNLF